MIARDGCRAWKDSVEVDPAGSRCCGLETLYRHKERASILWPSIQEPLGLYIHVKKNILCNASQVSCPQNGTAVLKGLMGRTKHTWNTPIGQSKSSNINNTDSYGTLIKNIRYHHVITTGISRGCRAGGRAGGRVGGRSMKPLHCCCLKVNPLRTAVPILGQTATIISRLPAKRDCCFTFCLKSVKTSFRTAVPFWGQSTGNLTGLSPKTGPQF